MNIPEKVTPERAGFSAGRLQRVDALMRRYVENERLAGTIGLIYRRGQVIYAQAYGYRERATDAPMTLDTIFRIYSMTKPITTVAALMLYEQGHFLLDDPIAKYLPAFEGVQVYAGARAQGLQLVAPQRPPTIQDLMRHTAGLSYGWFQDSPVETLYREAVAQHRQRSLAEAVDQLAQLPLLYQPGTAWRYSFATDVLGRLVEVISGETLDDFFRAQIFVPLGMDDTGFYVPAEERHRFASMYSIFDDIQFGRDLAQVPPDLPLKVIEPADESPYLQPPVLFSGGGGLVSTTGDYLRFCQMLLNRGILDSMRLLSPKTVDLMTTNHLPAALIPIVNGADVSNGYGFGLGVNVLVDVAASAMAGSQGSYGWSGAAGTSFWIDPEEALIGLFMMQFMPNSLYPVRREFRAAVYQALVD